MRAAPVARDAGDDGDRRTFIILSEAKIFLVDPTGHLVHMTGDILFRFGVAGEIQVMRSAVGGWGVAEITFYTQGGLPAVHDLIQVVMADILWQHLEILWAIFLRAGGGHADDHQTQERGDNDKLPVV